MCCGSNGCKGRDCISIGGSGSRGAMMGGSVRSRPPPRAPLLGARSEGSSRSGGLSDGREAEEVSPRSGTSSSDQSLKLASILAGRELCPAVKAFWEGRSSLLIGGGVRGPRRLLLRGCWGTSSSSETSDSGPRDRFRFFSKDFFLQGERRAWGASATEDEVGGSGLLRSPPPDSSSLRFFFRIFF